MTGSVRDPRLEAVRDLMSLLRTAGSRSGPVLITPVEMLARLDAADEASGVRRVTAQELAGQVELARQDERQRLADAILPGHWQTMQMWGGIQRLACGRCSYGDGVRFLWPCPTRRAITGEAEPEADSALLSADSPVGGVS